MPASLASEAIKKENGVTGNRATRPITADVARDDCSDRIGVAGSIADRKMRHSAKSQSDSSGPTKRRSLACVGPTQANGSNHTSILASGAAGSEHLGRRSTRPCAPRCGLRRHRLHPEVTHPGADRHRTAS